MGESVIVEVTAVEADYMLVDVVTAPGPTVVDITSPSTPVIDIVEADYMFLDVVTETPAQTLVDITSPGTPVIDIVEIAGPVGPTGPMGPQGVPGPQGPPGTSGAALKTVWGETPSGVVDGVNKSYGTAYQFTPNLLSVFLNGLRQRRPDDYAEIGVQSFRFVDAPLPGDSLSIDYIQP